MINPLHVDKKYLQELVQYLVVEQRQAEAERGKLEESWTKFFEAYRAKPAEEYKMFPFPGAANIIVPIIAIDVESIYAQITATLFAADSVFTTRAKRPDMIQASAKFNEFLVWAETQELDLFNELCDWVLDILILGTSVLKTRYRREYKKVYEFREMQTRGGQEVGGSSGQQVMAYLHDNPVVEHIPLWDFYIQAAAYSIETSPWCSQRVRLTWEQFDSRIRQGVYVNQDSYFTKALAHDPVHKVERARQRLDQVVPSYDNRLEFMEFWVQDAYIHGPHTDPCSLVLTIHMPSSRTVRIDYNPWFNQEKPYEKAVFFRQSKRFYGIGLAEMLFPFQEEITTIHNQRLDRNTVFNAPFITAIKNANFRDDEAVWPGRIKLVDSHDEIMLHHFGRDAAAHDTKDDENFSRQYATERSGASDYVTGGDAPSIGYSTASVAAQMLREGKKKFDQVMRECRRCLSKTGMRVLELYQQFNQGGKAFYALGQKDGELVQKILEFPVDLIRMGLAVDVTATSAAYNKEVEIRTNMLVMKELMGYYQQIMQYMQIVLNPQVPPPLRAVAARAMQGLTILLNRIIDAYGIQDTDQLLVDMEATNGGGPPQAMGQPAVQPGGTPMATGPAQPTGMAPLPALPAGADQGAQYGSPNGNGTPGRLPGAGRY